MGVAFIFFFARPCPASVTLRKAAQGPLLSSTAGPVLLPPHGPFPGTLGLERAEVPISGGRLVTGQGLRAKARVFPGPELPGAAGAPGEGDSGAPGKETEPWRKGRERRGTPGLPRPRGLLLVIHPLPHPRVVFTRFVRLLSFLLSQTAGVAGAPGGGFQVAGCLWWLFKAPDSPSPT